MLLRARSCAHSHVLTRLFSRATVPQECAAGVIRGGGTVDAVTAPTAAMYGACLEQKRRQIGVRGLRPLRRAARCTLTLRARARWATSGDLACWVSSCELQLPRHVARQGFLVL